jgi:uracil-DNA glycosylase family 4
VNAPPVIDVRNENVLRELNLYPLWQLRVPVSANFSRTENSGSQSEDSVSAVAKILEPIVVEQIIAKTAIVGKPEDCSDLGWTELKQRVMQCTACNLRAGCLQTVFGMGDEKADWLLVGTWPTEDDETSGHPFAGEAGKLLDNMLAAIKLKRGENVYLANIAKCSGSIKHAPQADEIAQCLPYLQRQIQLLQPKLIVVLGHAAATTLLGEDREWDSLLGMTHEYISHAKNGLKQTIPLIITHHPAALLLAPLNKAQTWRDLCLARDTMLRLTQAA